jgi:hypothetical protein
MEPLEVLLGALFFTAQMEQKSDFIFRKSALVKIKF